EILVITRSGIIIRTEASGIRLTGRNSQGVRVIRLDEGDSVMGVTIVENDDVDPDKLESAEEARAQHAAEVAPAAGLMADADEGEEETGIEGPETGDEGPAA